LLIISFNNQLEFYLNYFLLITVSIAAVFTKFYTYAPENPGVIFANNFELILKS